MAAPQPPAQVVLVPPNAPAVPATVEDVGRWKGYENQVASGAGVTPAEIGNVAVFTFKLTQDVAGKPTWLDTIPEGFKDYIGQELGPRVDDAMANKSIYLHNLLAKSHNHHVMPMRGRILVPLQDAEGAIPEDFPKTTDVLTFWSSMPSVDPDTWKTLHKLLRHYAVLDPANQQPFVAQGGGIPTIRGAGVVDTFRSRVAAFEAFIQLS